MKIKIGRCITDTKIHKYEEKRLYRDTKYGTEDIEMMRNGK